MATISRNFSPARTFTPKKATRSLTDVYMDYIKNRKNDRIFWYMSAIIYIPCLFMVVSTFAMAAITPNYIWFIGLTMLMFFANVVAHIAETKNTFYIPLYHATIVLMTIIPIITYFIVSA